MDDPVFRRLRDVIGRPCRSKDWFGLAEQAINTVYALAESPHVFCDELIKALSINVFTKRQTQRATVEGETQALHNEDTDDPEQAGQAMDTREDGPEDLTDAFELSKLLFVVGHVAIKHIVYLEQVEREWKREKDDSQTGNACQC